MTDFLSNALIGKMYLTVILLFCAIASSAFAADKLPEVGLEVDGLVQYYGYPLELHSTQTEDGYILSIHRIPRASTERNYRGVVLLMPGLLTSAAAFTVNGKESSTAFVLANAGYDVWIANPRGTTYSRKHITLDPDNEKEDFWDFSFHDIGYYDAPATIDYILQATGEEKLFYVGHSQGTTSFFVMASERPEYNEKIRLMVALAPVAFMKNLPNTYLQALAKNEIILELILSTIKFYELLPHWPIITEIGQLFCNDEVETQKLCAELFFAISGPNEKQLNKTMIPVITSTLPAGASAKQILHFAQEIASGKFRQYDYGILKNLAKYGQLTPPEYNLNNIAAPVALFYGTNDYLSAVDDIYILRDKLPNMVYEHLVEDEEFAHLDFMVAIDLNKLVHKYVLQVMDGY